MNNVTTLTMNRMNVADNLHQGVSKKVLCVCSAGVLRSPTLANVLTQEYGYNCRAVGSDSAFALIPLSMTLVYWADEIWCVDGESAEETIEFIGSFNLGTRRLVRLHLEDTYDYMQEDLVEDIKYQIHTMRLLSEGVL